MICVNRKNKCIGSFPPFHIACLEGHFKIAKLFLQKSADFDIDLNAKDNDGWTPLHTSCRHCLIKTAKMLVEKSAKFNIDLNTKDIFSELKSQDLACEFSKILK